MQAQHNAEADRAAFAADHEEDKVTERDWERESRDWTGELYDALHELEPVLRRVALEVDGSDPWYGPWSTDRDDIQRRAASLENAADEAAESTYTVEVETRQVRSSMYADVEYALRPVLLALLEGRPELDEVTWLLDCILAHDRGRRDDMAEPGYCRHGVYVGGCGVDWMCGACEAGAE